MKRMTIEAVYQDGVLRPTEPLDLDEGTHVRITIDTGAETEPGGVWASVLAWQERWPQVPTILPARLSGILSLEWTLFGLAMLVYALTRLWALDQFPIYFFTDEAIHPVQGTELIRNGLRDFERTLLPTYFKNGPLWNLSLSVYIHALTASLFGMSIWVTRATSALISLVGAAAVGFTLKYVFHNRFWWVGVLFMTITPAWFLHSRTAFETVLMVLFYACFLLFYLLYRYRSPSYLFPALLFGAATFYAYANGQAVMVVTGFLLLLSDIRYHFRHRRIALAGLVVLYMLALPYVRFRLTHPEAMQFQLRMLDSYWLRAIPIEEKLARFRDTYLYGLSPQYWFFTNTHDLVRHLMKGYPHILTVELPLALAGLGISLWRFRSSAHRAIIFACLATPIGAALVDVGITRVLAFVVPATLLACLGLDWLLSRVKSPPTVAVLNIVLSLGLSLTAFWMLRDALVNGPVWFHDYGLYGMQWGARPLFTDVIPGYLKRDPSIRVMVSPTWANGTDVLTAFFIREQDRPRVQMFNVDYFLSEKRPLDANMIHIMTALEYERALASGKFKSVEVERVLSYPDGSPGFYFARLTYADDVDAIFAVEKAERRQLVEGQVRIGDQMVRVRHSILDAGQLKDMFDGDRFTLARGMEANPFIIELLFPEPRLISGAVGDFGSMDLAWTIELYTLERQQPIVHGSTYRDLPPDPHIEVIFEGGPKNVSKIRMEILNLYAGQSAKIHIRELAFR